MSVGSAALLYGSRSGSVDACIFHGLHGLQVLFQNLDGAFGDLQLAVQHQQGVVHVGYAGDDLRLDGLFVELRLLQANLCLSLRVQQLTEEVDLPACGDGQGVDLCSLSLVPAADGSLRRQGKRRSIGKTGRHQCGLCLFHVQGGTAQVTVVGECLLDKCLQLWVCEHFSPRQITEVGRICG